MRSGTRPPKYPWAFADNETLQGRVGSYVLRSPDGTVLVDAEVGRQATVEDASGRRWIRSGKPTFPASTCLEDVHRETQKGRNRRVGATYRGQRRVVRRTGAVAGRRERGVAYTAARVRRGRLRAEA